MRQSNVNLETNRPILDQILEINKLTYEEFASRLGFSELTFREIRSGSMRFWLSMEQVKVLAELLKPFGVVLEDLSDDWIIENKKV